MGHSFENGAKRKIEWKIETEMGVGEEHLIEINMSDLVEKLLVCQPIGSISI